MNRYETSLNWGKAAQASVTSQSDKIMKRKTRALPRNILLKEKSLINGLLATKVQLWKPSLILKRKIPVGALEVITSHH